MDEKKCPCDAMIEVQKNIRDHEKRLADGNVNFALIQQTLQTIQEDMREIKSDIKNIKEKPAKRWESVTSIITNWIVIGILAYIASHLVIS